MDATKPTDVEIVSALAAYIREARAGINALSGGDGVGVTVLTIAAGAVALVVGTDLGLFGLEVVIVDAAAAVNIAKITNGVQGQVKVFVFQDSDIKFVDGLAVDGKIYLNQLPPLTSYTGHIGDVIALVNVGGNGSTVQGYWKELFRTEAVK